MLPKEEIIEAQNTGRGEPTWLDHMLKAYFNPLGTYAEIAQAMAAVWMPFTHMPHRTASLWESATPHQVAHIVGMRHYLTAHKSQIEKETDKHYTLSELFNEHDAGIGAPPASKETIEATLDTFTRYGTMHRPNGSNAQSHRPPSQPKPGDGEILYPFGEPINLEDLALGGAFKGNEETRRDCGFLNLEHCVFNTKKYPYAPMQRADLRDANLRRADLKGCDLSGSDLCGADLRGADLSTARLNNVLYDNRTMIDQRTKLPSGFFAHLVTQFDRETGNVIGFKNQRGLVTGDTGPYPRLLGDAPNTAKPGIEKPRHDGSVVDLAKFRQQQLHTV